MQDPPMGMEIITAWTVLALAAVPAAGAGRTYVVDGSASSVNIHVGRSGILGFAGHKHEVVAPRLSGEVLADPQHLARSRVSLEFEAGALKVTGEGEPAKDVPRVQETMVGPKVLDAARFPTVSFRSRSVEGSEVSPGVYDLRVVGELTLHGMSRTVSLPVRVEVSPGGLTASGRASIRQKEFGIEPVSAGVGTVKVKNEVGVDYRIVARAAR